MSGKSTLLRAVGINVLLGRAGLPACAASLRMPPFRLATSIRVNDSLTEGVSFFMAELLRLKEVVAAADTAQTAGQPLVFLFDEILRGTNSAERRIAVCGVVRHMLQCRAVGMITTHDLALADADGLAEAACSVHLREIWHGLEAEQPLTFDYVLRPGPAPTTNALHLLRVVGLPAEADPPATPSGI
jgi:DNA mismatch repair ATPase MutS